LKNANAAELRYILDDCTASALAISTEFLDKINGGVAAGRRRVIMYTGGTTGAPKGVIQCQAGYVALAQNMLLSLAPQGIRRTDSWLVRRALPWWRVGLIQ
jgi:acyl-coenzyme A synthetase/AMP-(fatty) acid ligase